MDKFRKGFNAVFIAKDTLFLRKTYFYYFLIIFIVVCRIDLMTIHDLRLRYLMGMYQNIPRTHEVNVAVLLTDYATRLAPGDVGTWVMLAESSRQIGDLARAARAYEKAIDLRPTNRKLRVDLAEVYTQLHQEQKAAEVLGELSQDVK